MGYAGGSELPDALMKQRKESVKVNRDQLNRILNDAKSLESKGSLLMAIQTMRNPSWTFKSQSQPS